MIAQFPPLQPGELERWLASAVAVAGVVIVVLKLIPRRTTNPDEFVRQEEFRQFRTSVERELGGLRDRIDSRHLAILESIETLKAALLAESERRDTALQKRLSHIESNLARLDERTKKP